MTSRSPETVYYEYYARAVSAGGAFDVPVENIIPTVDLDRDIYSMATIVTKPITDAQWVILDPRQSTVPAQVAWQVTQKTLNTFGVAVALGNLPYGVAGNTTANMYVRTAVRDHMTGRVTLTLAGPESMVADKHRIATNGVDTGATTVRNLVYWSLSDVFGGYVLSDQTPTSGASSASTAIPAGDRRVMLPGESHADLLQPELDGINARLASLWGRTWVLTPRRLAGAETLKLAAYLAAASDADPIVTGCVETVSRAGDWADGVLVSYAPPGVAITYQRSGVGNNTRGLVVKRDRPGPAYNAADQIVARTITRGCDITITARARFDLALASTDAALSQPVTVQLSPTRTLTALIRAVEWDTAAGTMSIRAQTGDPIT